jgi:Uma2 family endonuclease
MMPAVAPVMRYPTFADVLRRLGDVPAERVRTFPLPGTATVKDLLNPKITGDRLCELVDGILVEKAMGWREGGLGLWIGTLLNVYLMENNVGYAAGSDGMVRFKLNLVRMPDVSFIRWDRVDDPNEIFNPNGAFLEVAPDLVVEVMSPSNTKREMEIKLEEYAKAGVQLAWYVYPTRREVDVYPNARLEDKFTIGIDGTLDGGEAVPGFVLPVAKIFEDRTPAGRKGARPPKKPKKG